MGSDESHFNVTVGIDGQSHKTVSTNHNLFEGKGEPKRYRTEVLLLTSLTPYRRAKAALALSVPAGRLSALITCFPLIFMSSDKKETPLDTRCTIGLMLNS